MKNIVIVGGGIAGHTVSESLRQGGSHDPIVLVSEEQHPLYSRVLLPHYVKGKIPREKVFLKKESWYEEQKIEWLPGLRVQALDRPNRFLTLSDGRELPFDTLVLATGGQPRLLPQEPRGVSYLNTVDDADHVLELLRGCSKEARAVVIGGGFIGCEYVDIFVKAGIPTTIVLRNDRFFSSTFDEALHDVVMKHLESHQVSVRLGVDAEICGDQTVSHVQAGGETLPCELVGVGVGHVPDADWIKEAGLELHEGIVVDKFLQTSFEHIFALGDAAEFEDVISGRHRKVGNWQNALFQARTLGKTLLGEKTEFRMLTSYTTNMLGLPLTFLGDVEASKAEETKTEMGEGWGKRLFYRGGRLVGAALVGKVSERTALVEEMQRPFLL